LGVSNPDFKRLGLPERDLNSLRNWVRKGLRLFLEVGKREKQLF